MFPHPRAEFERQAGRAAAKKWKTSIRIDKGGGAPGITMEAWLIQMGVDPVKPPKPSRATLDTVRRRQMIQTHRPLPPPPSGAAGPGQAAGAAGKTGRGKSGHREGCMCVICKQARRSGKQWAGLGTGGAADGSGTGGGGGEGGGTSAGHRTEAGARWRAGKRAFLSALPQAITVGVKPHPPHRVPLSRCWAPEDWAAHRWRQNQRNDAAGAAITATGVAALLPTPPPVLIAGGASALVEDNLSAKVSLGPGAAAGGRALTLRDKLELCCATEHERLAFGKSGIHGWGLFARVPMPQDSMVVEFRGEMVRRSVADMREARYRAEGTDCYSFNLDDDVVMDATRAGTIARFTVSHSV